VAVKLTYASVAAIANYHCQPRRIEAAFRKRGKLL